MNVSDREILLDYFLGRLNESDAVAVERKAATDAEFARTFDALRRETAVERVRLAENVFLTPPSSTPETPRFAVKSEGASDSFKTVSFNSPIESGRIKEKNDKNSKKRRKNRFAFVPKRVVAPRSVASSAFLEKKATVVQRKPSVPLPWRDAWRRLFFPREATFETRSVPLDAAELARLFVYSPSVALSTESKTNLASIFDANLKGTTSETAPGFVVLAEEPASTDPDFVADSTFVAPRNVDASFAPSFRFDVETAFESDAADVWSRCVAPKIVASSDARVDGESLQALETLAESSLSFDVFATVEPPVWRESFDELAEPKRTPLLIPLRSAESAALDSGAPNVVLPPSTSLRPEYPTFLDETDVVDEFQPLELQEETEESSQTPILSPLAAEVSAVSAVPEVASPVVQPPVERSRTPLEIETAQEEPDAPDFAPEDSSFLPQEDAVYYAVERESEDEDSEPTISSEDRRLAELLGRAPSKFDREEYYWEALDESAENDDESEAVSEKSSNVFWASLRRIAQIAAVPEIAVGRAALGFVGYYRVRELGRGEDFETQNAARSGSRRKQGRLSDMMISIVAGILIAVLVVFPLLRVGVLELYSVIVKSAVRKIGQNVAISAQTSHTDLLPLISEQLLYPQYESVDLSGGAAQETSSGTTSNGATFRRPTALSTSGTSSLGEPSLDGASFDEPSVLDISAPAPFPSIGDAP